MTKTETPEVVVPQAAAEAPSLGSRLLSPRTLISLVVAFAIVALAVWRAPIKWSDAWSDIRHASLGLYCAALLTYYSSFIFRALRWRILLANTGEHHSALQLGWIILNSFFVNCVVPAKMGDVYRAYLLRQQENVGASKALGTVIAERLLDLCVLMVLLLAAGFVVLHNRASLFLIPYMIAGGLLCCLGIAAVFVMRAGRGQRLLRLLPEAIFQRYESFRSGTVHSLDRIPLLVGLTVAVWLLEGTRLGLVVAALGNAPGLGPAQFLLIALVAALLTTVPFLPGGLGLVEAGMGLVLITIGGLSSSASVSITLLDRSISYGSLVIFGFVAFSITQIRLGGRRRAALQR